MEYVANLYKQRRVIIVLLAFVVFVAVIIINSPKYIESISLVTVSDSIKISSPAIDVLNTIAIKGRAPKTDYTREQFGANWAINNGCDTRNIILNRDLTNVVVDTECNVTSGTLNDPYTGTVIQFTRGSDTSNAVQIDHVVALSDAWQKGAQQLSLDTRQTLANDPLELLAVSGPTNLQKGDGDAATWLPSNKTFRCQYVARQIAVKQKYSLWMTQAEHDAIDLVLSKCPNQKLPIP